MSMNIVETVHFNSSSEFIDALSLRRPEFASISLRGWIFRGHSDDENFNLIPSALRDDSKELASLWSFPIKNQDDQFQAEHRVLSNFLKKIFL